ncbi:MAG: glycosyl hydrolase 108 family protein [Deltaproteobacteria bacterium]
MTTCLDEAFKFTVGEEGGYQCDPSDPGNWTGGDIGKGECRGTKYGVSARAYPMLIIKDITVEDAKLVFRQDYWLPAGCDKLSYPLCLVVADNAYHSGVGAALQNLRQYPDWRDLIIERIEDMVDIVDRRPTSLKYLKGWVKRCVALYRLASGNEHPINT